MKVIGFCGFGRVGKDSAAAAIKHMGFLRYAYADDLKHDFSDFIFHHYGWDIHQLTDDQKEIVRPYLVAHGAGMRAIDAWYWVNQLDTYLKEEPEDACIAITDVRYLNEVIDILENKRGQVIYIERPGFGPLNDEEARSFGEVFASQYAYNSINPRVMQHIKNDGDLEDFQHRIMMTVKLLLDWQELAEEDPNE